MDEYPSNSHRQKPNDKDEPKKIDRVIEGVVIRRKKPLGKRFKDTFMGGDTKSVWAFVVLTVVVPATKNIIADVVNTFFERMLFGDSHHGTRRSMGRSNSLLGHVNYGSSGSNRYNTSSFNKRDEPRNVSHKSRASHNFDEIILETRVEANEVIDSISDVIGKYGSASVADLYEMINVTAEYTDGKWGWTDVSGAGVMHVRGGYLLNLPKPEQLD